MEQKKSKSHQSVVAKMCVSGALAAVCFVLDYLATEISFMFFGNTIKISFSGLPIILAAIICGPLYGAATGFIGAMLTQLLSYGFTATTILWVLPATSRGIVVGLLFIAFRRSLAPHFIILETVISSLIVTVLNSLALYVDGNINGYYNPVTFAAGLVPRIASGVATAVILAVIATPIIRAAKKNVRAFS